MKNESVLNRIRKRRKEEIKQLNIEDEKSIKQKIFKFFINFINLFFMFFMLFIIFLCLIFSKDVERAFDWLYSFIIGK